MNLLLDSHIVLWVLEDNPRLTTMARKHIDDADAIFVSSVTLWEFAIKNALGKLKLDLEKLPHRLDASGLVPLEIKWKHALGVRNLPLLHRDPFDRLLIAQAEQETLHLLTHDPAVKAYGDFVTLV